MASTSGYNAFISYSHQHDGMLGPTLRHLAREGTAGVQRYWSGQGGLIHLVSALVFGGIMTYVLAGWAWRKLESAHSRADAEDAGRTRREVPLP